MIPIRTTEGHKSAGANTTSVGAVAVCRLYGESKDGAGTQDERSEGLSASRGRGKFRRNLSVTDSP
jgi:hypothetical protein